MITTQRQPEYRATFFCSIWKTWHKVAWNAQCSEVKIHSCQLTMSLEHLILRIKVFFHITEYRKMYSKVSAAGAARCLLSKKLSGKKKSSANFSVTSFFSSSFYFIFLLVLCWQICKFNNEKHCGLARALLFAYISQLSLSYTIHLTTNFSCFFFSISKRYACKRNLIPG